MRKTKHDALVDAARGELRAAIELIDKGEHAVAESYIDTAQTYALLALDDSLQRIALSMGAW